MFHVKMNGAGVTVICFVKKKWKIFTVVWLIPWAVNMPKFGNNSVCVENFLIQIYKNSLEANNMHASVEMKDFEDSNLLSPQKHRQPLSDWCTV